MITPRATYRLQLCAETTFHEAADLVPYLTALGVSHLHLSPCLEARAGSAHGYDVVDFERPRHELGGAEGLMALFDVARRHGLGILLDFVPNHMAAAPEGPWWRDVLESGRASPFASFFDIDWEVASATGGLILPILGDQYGRLLESGEIRVVRAGADFTVRYADHAFPVAPDTLAEILVPAVERCGSDRLDFAARALGALAPSDRALTHARAEERRRDLTLARGLLDEALTGDASTAAAVDEELARLQGDPDRLDAFLGRQPYRLAWWRMAERALAYRRFFDIDDLVALRMEDPRVFEATHALVIRWLRDGLIDGIRVDHIDGLRDPEAYLHRLRGAWPDGWILVEKILEPEEPLPATWPVDGTTGYDFLQRLDGLFIDPAGRLPLSDLYAEFTGQQ
ncbi:MAG TPA: malto-oligosyltrehalose synthase, partial [Alphaproteobacteria bacterium]|nr:malto-oligosyltrehalose synthase [Alphaproteobacteria bacterium]